MTTSEYDDDKKAERLKENMARVEALTERLTTALAHRTPPRPSLQAPDPDLFLHGSRPIGRKWPRTRQRRWSSSWSSGANRSSTIWTRKGAAKRQAESPGGHTPDDRRFANPLWKTHPYFNYIKQQYLIASESMQDAIEDLESVDAREKRRLQYFTTQLVDMMAPTNFPGDEPGCA